MLDKKIQTAFAEMTPTDEQKEAMLQNIWAAHDERTAQHRRTTRRAFVPVLAAALVLVLGTAALATGTLGNWINWRGEVIGEMVSPQVTPQRTEAETAEWQHMDDVLSTADYAENELISVIGGGVVGMNKTVGSLEELEALLQDSPLQAPANIPEGYELTEAHVSYACREGYAYELVSSEEDSHGLTVERYEVPREGLIVSGYGLDYRDAEGSILYVKGNLLDGNGEMFFGVEEGQTSRIAAVEGMDNALVVEADTGALLSMRKELAEPVSYTSQDLLFGAQPTEGGERFGEIVYMVSADALNSAQLLAMFG